MCLCEGYKGKVTHMEEKLGEYSIVKEPREERPYALVGQIFSNTPHLLSMENIMVSKIDMVVATLGLMV